MGMVAGVADPSASCTSVKCSCVSAVATAAVSSHVGRFTMTKYKVFLIAAAAVTAVHGWPGGSLAKPWLL